MAANPRLEIGIAANSVQSDALPADLVGEHDQGADMNVAIQIPDDVGRALMARGADVTRTVLEAVATEAYRSGAITPAQVQEMLGFRSRWETESCVHRADAYHDYTMDDLDRDIAAIRAAARQ